METNVLTYAAPRATIYIREDSKHETEKTWVSTHLQPVRPPVDAAHFGRRASVSEQALPLVSVERAEARKKIDLTSK
jgi:hypothetical protein